MTLNEIKQKAMTDIVERLEGPLSGINRQWVLEAAAEIKQLRTSLNTISHLADDEVTMGCSGYDHYQMHMAVAIARRALEPKPDAP